MKKAFIIAGPEQSCTRLSLLLFKVAGIVEVGDDMGRALDLFVWKKHLKLLDENDLVCARRSIPHGKDKEYLNIPEYEREFIARGFLTYWIVPVRTFLCMEESKRSRNTVLKDQIPIKNIQNEYTHIFRGLSHCQANCYILSTSLLMVDLQREIKSLSKFTGIDFPISKLKKEVFDADIKYYSNLD